MPVKKATGTRRRGQITTARVVSAAVSIVDEEGVRALTLRRLAEKFGVTPMAIYRHVRDKSELLDLVVNEVIAGMADPPRSGSWRSKTATYFGEFRRVLVDHPGIATTFVARPTPVPSVIRITDRAVGLLLDGGFDPRSAVRAFDVLLMYSIGSILWQIPRSGGERAPLLGIAAFGTDEIPHLAAVSAEFQKRDPDEFFRSGLEMVLNGLEKTRGR